MNDIERMRKAKGLQAQFELQHIYTKDVSFEAPFAPEIFQNTWEPKVSMDLQQECKDLNSESSEVSLMITVTAKVKEKIAFIAEVKQSGIFIIKNFTGEQKKQFLNVFCPNLLYPYVRESISSLVVRGGFAPLYITPVNFEALYQQKLKNS